MYLTPFCLLFVSSLCHLFHLSADRTPCLYPHISCQACPTPTSFAAFFPQTIISLNGPDPKCCLCIPSTDAAWHAEFLVHFVFYSIKRGHTWSLSQCISGKVADNILAAVFLTILMYFIPARCCVTFGRLWTVSAKCLACSLAIMQDCATVSLPVNPQRIRPPGIHRCKKDTCTLTNHWTIISSPSAENNKPMVTSSLKVALYESTTRGSQGAVQSEQHATEFMTYTRTQAY